MANQSDDYAGASSGLVTLLLLLAPSNSTLPRNLNPNAAGNTKCLPAVCDCACATLQGGAGGGQSDDDAARRARGGAASTSTSTSTGGSVSAEDSEFLLGEWHSDGENKPQHNNSISATASIKRAAAAAAGMSSSEEVRAPARVVLSCHQLPPLPSA